MKRRLLLKIFLSLPLFSLVSLKKTEQKKDRWKPEIKEFDRTSLYNSHNLGG